MTLLQIKAALWTFGKPYYIAHQIHRMHIISVHDFGVEIKLNCEKPMIVIPRGKE